MINLYTLKELYGFEASARDGVITVHDLLGDRDITAQELEECELYEATLKANASIPSVVTMRQARLALLQSNMLSIVDTAIYNGTDEAMKIEWEYATEVRRDWDSLISMTQLLGMSAEQLDELFLLASTK